MWFFILKYWKCSYKYKLDIYTLVIDGDKNNLLNYIITYLVRYRYSL